MNLHKILPVFTLAIGALVVTLPVATMAQDSPQIIEEVIVTGVARPTTKFESSMSVTSLPSDDVIDFAPRSTAEIFRNLPGIQSEATSGDANANIKVRGMPISSGGSRYLSLQEDGFPMLLVGDASFATADSFLRFDGSVYSVQAIRGGSASTQAYNAPGGIINFLSNTGDEASTSIGVTTGLDYDSIRLDFAHGGELTDDWTYHVGGYYRSGEGVRDADGDYEDGGQIKATFARDFDRASFRVHLKHLDDRVPTYLPLPAVSSGGSGFAEVGVDFGEGSLLLTGNDLLARRGGVESTDLEDGFEAKMTSIALVGDYQINDMLTAAVKYRHASIDGNFASAFPAEVYSNANGPAVRIHYFNTKLDDLDNDFADLSLTADFENVTIRAGVDLASQNLATTWGWNTYFRQLDGALTPIDQEGSVGGLLYGHPLWGNCCQRAYDFEIDGTAPYITLNGEIGDSLTWDISYRDFDYDVDGTFAETAIVTPLDINGDGVIASNEEGVPILGAPRRADYSADYDAWSFGVNYALNDSTALFFNISEGGSLSSPDRVTGNIRSDGSMDNSSAYSEVEQTEIGVKYQGDNMSLYVTLFDAETVEAREFEVTTQTVRENAYESKGLELEGDYDFGSGFGLKGSLTLTDAEIVRTGSGVNQGNQPRRQADYIFNLTGYYETDDWNTGLNLVGTDEVYVQDSNELKFDSYMTANLFVNYQFSDNWSASLNVNNLFDEEGFSEGEEGAAVAGDFVRVRPINGRTSSLSVRYDF